MAAGRPITRRAFPVVSQPAGGAASSALTVSGTIVPAGSAVEFAWGTGGHTPPATGWTAATTSDAAGNWSAASTRPASAGTYHLWARSKLFPRSAKPSGAVVVT